MSEIINEKELNEVSGGTAAGPSWSQNGMTFYRIVFGDTLIPISDSYKEDVQQYFDQHTLQ